MARLQQLAFGMASVLGGGAVSMTLMACYGPACANDTCTDEGSRAITADEITKLQATVGAGTWTGVKTNSSDACTLTVTGSIATPPSIDLSLTAGATTKTMSLQGDANDVDYVRVTDTTAEVTLSVGKSLGLTRRGNDVANVALDGLRCDTLKRQ